MSPCNPRGGASCAPFVSLSCCSAMVCGSVPGLRRGQIPNPPDQVRRRLPGRRAERHHRAHLLRLAATAPRPALRGREQGRPGRHDRGGVGDQLAARRLHHHVRRAEQRHRPDALQEPAVQSRARHHADRRHHAARQHDGGAAIAAGEDRRRVHRLRQGQPGQAHLRVVRQRHFGAHVGRAVQDHDRARHACTCPIAARPASTPTC